MRTRIHLLTVSLLCIGASCGTTSESAEPIGMLDPALNPAPAVEMASMPMSTGTYSHLPRFDSFAPESNVELEVGCYEGIFELEQKRMKMTGAGTDQTVIDGNLIVASQGIVSDLTVTGDVIFTGNNARMMNVRCLGQILDYGTHNRY